MGITNFDHVVCNEATINGQALAALVDDVAAIAGLSAAERAGLEALTLTAGGAVIAAPAAEAANARSVAVQVNDHMGTAMASRAVVRGFVSTDATGDVPGDGSATIVVSAGTDGAIVETDDTGFTAVTEADGDLDLVLTDSADAAQTVYVHIVLPSGKVVSSAAIAFADDTP